MKEKSLYIKLIPVMLAFFTMGFVDLVGIASNYVQKDLNLTDSEANILPSLVFFWFLIFSVPTGMLMNRIGRKKTVTISLVITLFSLLLPCFGDEYILMLVSFSLLGIGNASMQTSLNPLLSNIVSGSQLASCLTFGQFIKAIASFSAPYIAMWGATQTIPSLGLDWRILFPIYMLIAILAVFLLGISDIREEEQEGRSSTYKECFGLLGNPFILLMFTGIICHVGIDVGTNITAPKILMERLGINIHQASFAISLYFIVRTFGCLTGSFILTRWSSKRFLSASIACMIIAMIIFFFAETKILLYTAIALVGYGNSNVFSILFSQALLSMPEKQNEVSGLMIMGLFGGTVFPLLMGFASDAMQAQAGAFMVLTAGILYLLFLSSRLKT